MRHQDVEEFGQNSALQFFGPKSLIALPRNVNHDDRAGRIAANRSKEPVDDTRKRVRKMFDPHRARMRAMFFRVSKFVLGAAGLAFALAL